MEAKDFEIEEDKSNINSDKIIAISKKGSKIESVITEQDSNKDLTNNTETHKSMSNKHNSNMRNKEVLEVESYIQTNESQYDNSSSMNKKKSIFSANKGVKNVNLVIKKKIIDLNIKTQSHNFNTDVNSRHNSIYNNNYNSNNISNNNTSIGDYINSSDKKHKRKTNSHHILNIKNNTIISKPLQTQFSNKIFHVKTNEIRNKDKSNSILVYQDNISNSVNRNNTKGNNKNHKNVPSSSITSFSINNGINSNNISNNFMSKSKANFFNQINHKEGNYFNHNNKIKHLKNNSNGRSLVSTSIYEASTLYNICSKSLYHFPNLKTVESNLNKKNLISKANYLPTLDVNASHSYISHSNKNDFRMILNNSNILRVNNNILKIKQEIKNKKIESRMQTEMMHYNYLQDKFKEFYITETGYKNKIMNKNNFNNNINNREIEEIKDVNDNYKEDSEDSEENEKNNNEDNSIDNSSITSRNKSKKNSNKDVGSNKISNSNFKAIISHETPVNRKSKVYFSNDQNKKDSHCINKSIKTEFLSNKTIKTVNTDTNKSMFKLDIEISHISNDNQRRNNNEKMFNPFSVSSNKSKDNVNDTINNKSANKEDIQDKKETNNDINNDSKMSSNNTLKNFKSNYTNMSEDKDSIRNSTSNLFNYFKNKSHSEFNNNGSKPTLYEPNPDNIPFLEEEILKKQTFSSELNDNCLIRKECLRDFLAKTKEITLRKYANLHKIELQNRLKETFLNEKESAYDTRVNLNLSKEAFYDNFLVNFDKYCRKVKLLREYEYNKLINLKQNKVLLENNIKQVEIKLVKNKENIENCLEYRNFLMAVKTRDLKHFQNKNVKIFEFDGNRSNYSNYNNINTNSNKHINAILNSKDKNVSSLVNKRFSKQSTMLRDFNNPNFNNINNQIIDSFFKQNNNNKKAFLRKSTLLSEEILKPKINIFNSVSELIGNLKQIEAENLDYIHKYNHNREVLYSLISENSKMKTESVKMESSISNEINTLKSDLEKKKAYNKKIKADKQKLLQEEDVNLKNFSTIKNLIEKMNDKIKSLNIFKDNNTALSSVHGINNNSICNNATNNNNTINNINSSINNNVTGYELRISIKKFVSLGNMICYLEKGVDFLIEKSLFFQKLDFEKYRFKIKHLEIENRRVKTLQMQQELKKKRQDIVKNIVEKFNKETILPIKRFDKRYKPYDKEEIKKSNTKEIKESRIEDFLFND